MLALGPGLGRSDGTAALTAALIRKFPGKIVLDADALWAVSLVPDILREAKSEIVITPHEGEFLRLGGSLENGRERGAWEFARRYGCVTVLKGHRTIIAHPAGRMYVIEAGNPGMANVGHELGTRAAALVLAGDIAKTLAAWLVARALFPADAAVCGLAATTGATLGHNFPAWHRFRGGKGVTTTCAGIILAAPALGIASAVAGLVVVLASGYLCVGAEAITLALRPLPTAPSHARAYQSGSGRSCAAGAASDRLQAGPPRARRPARRSG